MLGQCHRGGSGDQTRGKAGDRFIEIQAEFVLLVLGQLVFLLAEKVPTRTVARCFLLLDKYTTTSTSGQLFWKKQFVPRQ